MNSLSLPSFNLLSLIDAASNAGLGVGPGQARHGDATNDGCQQNAFHILNKTRYRSIQLALHLEKMAAVAVVSRCQFGVKCRQSPMSGRLKPGASMAPGDGRTYQRS